MTRSQPELKTVPGLPRILLAEDGPTAMTLAVGLFDHRNVELDVVTDGRSALETLAENPRAYALVILAYDLPEISGLDCIRFIRKMLARLPMLVLIETPGPDRLEELAGLGISHGHILEKPATPESLAARVGKMLNI